MQYMDKLYGKITLPDYIGEIIETPLFQRLRDISTNPLPRKLSTHPYASRFEHSVGVCHLMDLATKRNVGKLHRPLCLVSALLHDAGNPPFAHLSEPVLNRVIGKNGETFLPDMIERFGLNKLLQSLKIPVEEILSMVTGNSRPISDILHGSMDVDNLDNVGRYWFKYSSGEKPFDGEVIANGYRFREEGPCYLPIEFMEEAKKWQETRRLVYEKVYSEPNLGGGMMVCRAIDLAYQLEKLQQDFFYLSEAEALKYLSDRSDQSKQLLRQVAEQHWYEKVYAMETMQPPEKLISGCEDTYLFRSTIADQIIEEFKIPSCDICVYVGRGRDFRRIDLPFIGADGSTKKDEGAESQIYRLKIYLNKESATKGPEIALWAEKVLG